MNNIFTIVGPVIVFVAVFGYVAYNRYLQHKETMALAEKGLLPAEDPQDKSKNILRWGMIFSIQGAILTLLLVPFAWSSYWTLLGLLPLAFGLGLILIYVYSQDNPPPKEKKPPQEKKAKKPATSESKKSTVKEPKKN